MPAIDLKHYDAIIVGAGVIGATLALGLAQKNSWKVAVIEKSQPHLTPHTAPTESNLRATALGLSSKALLSDLGVWQSLSASQCCPYGHMFVWDENSDAELRFTASDYAVDALGFIVDHFALQQYLQDKIASSDRIDAFYGVELQGVEQYEKGVHANIQGEHGQSTLSAHWLFAADGVNSVVRRMVEVNASQHDYHQQGIVAKIKTALPHQGTAWQRFLSTGPLALLPLSNGECSIVWSMPTAQASAFCELSEEQFVHRLELALQSRLGSIELRSERHSFPLRSVRAERYLKRSVVLLGDAAHGVHPMSGQGANLGFGDVITLLDSIQSYAADHPRLPRAFRYYERQQALTNTVFDTFQTGLDSIFRTENVMLNSLRRVGLQMVNQQPLIKSLFAQQVLGK